LENSKNESLLKEVESQVDRKKWVNKDGLLLGLKAIASRIRQLLLSIAMMTTSIRHKKSKMGPADLIRHITSQGGSM
jgi:hypothetical protein